MAHHEWYDSEGVKIDEDDLPANLAPSANAPILHCVNKGDDYQLYGAGPTGTEIGPRTCTTQVSPGPLTPPMPFKTLH